MRSNFPRTIFRYIDIDNLLGTGIEALKRILYCEWSKYNVNQKEFKLFNSMEKVKNIMGGHVSKTRYLTRKRIRRFITAVLLCFVFSLPNHAASITLCVDSQGNKVYTDNLCPPGFSEGKQAGKEKKVKQDPVSNLVDEKKRKVFWEKHKIGIDDIEMSWHLAKGTSNKGSVFHPQVEFTVHNGGSDTVFRLKFIAIFIDSNEKQFGETSLYINRLAASKVSKKKSMSPEMGYSYDEKKDYNDYKKNLITDTKFKVELFARYQGEKVKIATLDFFSKTIK